MSVQMMGAVISCGPQDQTQCFVMLTLANYADDFGFAFPAISTIARDGRCSEKTVMRQLAELEAAGWIHVARKVLNNKSNVYQLNLERMGVSVSPIAKRNPLFTRLLKRFPDRLSPIFRTGKEPVALPGTSSPVPFFAPEAIGDTGTFSTDNPQGGQGTSERGQRTSTTEIGDKLCPPNRQEPPQNRQGTINEVEPSPLPPKGGEISPAALVIPDPHHAQAWERIRIALKSDLRTISTRAEGNYRTIKAGQDDYETCFAECWLASITFAQGWWTFGFQAGSEMATKLGLMKYEGRLQKYLRLYFPMDKNDGIKLVVVVGREVHAA